MKIDIIISEIYNNHGLLKYFFRPQAQTEFNELFENVEESESEVFQAIENYSDDLNEVEEMFYNDSREEICKTLGLTLNNQYHD